MGHLKKRLPDQEGKHINEIIGRYHLFHENNKGWGISVLIRLFQFIIFMYLYTFRNTSNSITNNAKLN